MRFQGSLVAIVTPMSGNAVDLRTLRDLVEWQLAEGTDGIVPCGTTGEGATLTGTERAEVIRTVVETVKGRVPVIAGAGSNATHDCIDAVRLAKLALNDGVAGALVGPSAYLMKSPPTQIVDDEAHALCEQFIVQHARKQAKAPARG